jgi:hypothetical protein
LTSSVRLIRGNLRVTTSLIAHAAARLRRIAPSTSIGAVGLLALVGCSTPTEVAFAGPEDQTVLVAEDLEDAAITARVVEGGGEAPFEEATVEHDGNDVTGDAVVEGDQLRFALAHLDDGEHEVVVDVPGAGSETFNFAVDTTPPELEITEPQDPVVFGDDAVTIAGRTDSDAALTVGGADVAIDDDGTFSHSVEEVPDGPIQLTATDPHGNATEDQLHLTRLPSRVEVDEVRAVHVTPHAWATPSFRERILGMVDDGLINSIQLDLKDESGRIGYDSQVPLAQEIGAVEGVYDLEEAVAELHGRGIHIVGRIVAFRDPVLAGHAWENGQRDMVIQTPDGEPYAGYGGFTSFGSDEVKAYLIAIAEEAAAAGVDSILWDYIRRPDGPAENLVVPGLDPNASGRTLEQAVVDFTGEADAVLEPYRVQHGASVYGIAATRPTQIAQDIAGMAEYLDYVSPMIYPSHWGPGEYDVNDPNRQPYDIIYRSLEDFQTIVEGTDTRVVPWLEDTAYRAYDRPFHVREQIRATLDRGIDEWLMWDPVVGYTVEAYEPRD